MDGPQALSRKGSASQSKKMSVPHVAGRKRSLGREVLVLLVSIEELKLEGGSSHKWELSQWFQVSAIWSGKTLEEAQTHDHLRLRRRDPTPPALFDLFGLLAVRIRPRGFTLAILPRWFLALDVTFTRRGLGLAGVILGRGLVSLHTEHPAWGWWAVEASRHLRVGRLELIFDRKAPVAGLAVLRLWLAFARSWAMNL